MRWNMRQFKHSNGNYPDTYRAFIGEKGAITTRGHLPNRCISSLSEILSQVKHGFQVELKSEEFMYVDLFNKYFGIANARKENTVTKEKKCDCDFTLLLQRGCQCGGN